MDAFGIIQKSQATKLAPTGPLYVRTLETHGSESTMAASVDSVSQRSGHTAVSSTGLLSNDISMGGGSDGLMSSPPPRMPRARGPPGRQLGERAGSNANQPQTIGHAEDHDYDDATRHDEDDGDDEGYSDDECAHGDEAGGGGAAHVGSKRRRRLRGATRMWSMTRRNARKRITHSGLGNAPPQGRSRGSAPSSPSVGSHAAAPAGASSLLSPLALPATMARLARVAPAVPSATGPSLSTFLPIQEGCVASAPAEKAEAPLPADADPADSAVPNAHRPAVPVSVASTATAPSGFPAELLASSSVSSGVLAVAMSLPNLGALLSDHARGGTALHAAMSHIMAAGGAASVARTAAVAPQPVAATAAKQHATSMVPALNVSIAASTPAPPTVTTSATVINAPLPVLPPVIMASTAAAAVSVPVAAIVNAPTGFKAPQPSPLASGCAAAPAVAAAVAPAVVPAGGTKPPFSHTQIPLTGFSPALMRLLEVNPGAAISTLASLPEAFRAQLLATVTELPASLVAGIEIAVRAVVTGAPVATGVAMLAAAAKGALPSATAMAPVSTHAQAATAPVITASSAVATSTSVMQPPPVSTGAQEAAAEPVTARTPAPACAPTPSAAAAPVPAASIASLAAGASSSSTASAAPPASLLSSSLASVVASSAAPASAAVARPPAQSKNAQLASLLAHYGLADASIQELELVVSQLMRSGQMAAVASGGALAQLNLIRRTLAQRKERKAHGGERSTGAERHPAGDPTGDGSGSGSSATGGALLRRRVPLEDPAAAHVAAQVAAARHARFRQAAARAASDAIQHALETEDPAALGLALTMGAVDVVPGSLSAIAGGGVESFSLRVGDDDAEGNSGAAFVPETRARLQPMPLTCARPEQTNGAGNPVSMVRLHGGSRPLHVQTGIGIGRALSGLLTMRGVRQGSGAPRTAPPPAQRVEASEHCFGGSKPLTPLHMLAGAASSSFCGGVAVGTGVTPTFTEVMLSGFLSPVHALTGISAGTTPAQLQLGLSGARAVASAQRSTAFDAMRVSSHLQQLPLPIPQVLPSPLAAGGFAFDGPGRDFGTPLGHALSAGAAYGSAAARATGTSSGVPRPSGVIGPVNDNVSASPAPWPVFDSAGASTPAQFSIQSRRA